MLCRISIKNVKKNPTINQSDLIIEMHTQNVIRKTKQHII